MEGMLTTRVGTPLARNFSAVWWISPSSEPLASRMILGLSRPDTTYPPRTVPWALAFAVACVGDGVDQILAREDERRRRLDILDGHSPGRARLFGVAGAQGEQGSLALEVVDLLEKAQLRFVLDGLVRGAVFSDAEAVVRPDEDDGKLLERREAHHGLHVVGEREECRATGANAAMQDHADGERGHRELGDAGLQELSAEIALAKDRGLLEERVGSCRRRRGRPTS